MKKEAEAPPLETVPVAVAIITDEPLQRVLVTWNDNWGAFTLPMTKVRQGLHLENPAQTVLRAAAEVLGVPVRLKEPPPETRLAKYILSGRVGQTKRYDHHLFRVEPHPDFSEHLQVRRPLLWVSPYLLLERIYEPMSPSVQPLIRHILEEFGLPQRVQPTTTLVLTRTGTAGLEVLLRWNPSWDAWTLPAKRRDSGSGQVPAEMVANLVRGELGVVVPGLTILPREIILDRLSNNTAPPRHRVPTRYHHLVAQGTWLGTESFQSDEPLHWATLTEVSQLQTAALRPLPGTPPGLPGRISSTTQEITHSLGLLPEGGKDVDEAIKRWIAEIETRLDQQSR